MQGNTIFVVFFATHLVDLVFSVSENSTKLSQLPACKKCKIYASSVETAFQLTPKDLGDEGAWEFFKEKICHDNSYDVGCTEQRDGSMEFLREIWNREDLGNVYERICIDKLKVCCPNGTFGPQCKKCPSCHDHGRCRGDGTRKGNGECVCNPGYTGPSCSECAKTYYTAYKDDNKILCAQCHNACNREGCSAAGPKACLGCRMGWRVNPETGGCSDINECIEGNKVCSIDQFCVNKEGSYDCLDCDRSCYGCDGDGPDMCIKCREGYTLIEGKCTDNSTEEREQYVNMTRFLTYLGLCIATVVIFQSSTTKAYMVGAAVVAYIAASEYWLKTTPSPADIKSQLDNRKIENLIMNSL